MKHEDSFLYLTAIEGLSTLASEFPDTIMMTLIDEYSHTDRTQPDVRLKVGEALVRVVRLLGLSYSITYSNKKAGIIG